MKKLFWCLLLSAFIPATLTAQESGRYVRKQVRPGFFIPDRVFDRAEKLPAFPEPRIIEEATRDIAYEIPARHAPPVPVYEEPEPEEYFEFTIRPMAEIIDVNKVVPKNPEDTFEDRLAETEAYKTLVEEYRADLKVIAQTGKAPLNKRLISDLDKMITNDRIWVDEDFGNK